MFQSQLDESFVGHQYVIAAQAQSSVDLPDSYFWGCEGGPSDVVLNDHPDRTRRAYAAGLLRLYDARRRARRGKTNVALLRPKYGNDAGGNGGTWSAYQAIRHIFNGKDWKKDVISPNWRFLTDVRAGKLANFTWITPECAASDHLECGGGYGPRGFRRSSIRSARASSGIPPPSSCSGTTGAAFTITSRRRTKITTGSASASRCS